MAIQKLEILSILFGLFAYIYAQNAGDTLVLVDNLAIRETHSIFFKGLQGKFCRCISILFAYDND